MSNHRHATDRIDGQMIAECPNGCSSWEISMTKATESLGELIIDEFRECPECGAEMDTISQETNSEVLE